MKVMSIEEAIKANYGICAGEVHRNLCPSELTERAIKNEGARLTETGALVDYTGKYTGRSPKDRFIVEDESINAQINWSNENVKMSKATYDLIFSKALKYLQNREIYVFDGFAGADKANQINVRVINEYASQNLFMNNMLIRPKKGELDNFSAQLTIIAVPGLKLDAKECGINSEAAVILNLAKNIVLIAGTKYSGEMKKAVFSFMNYRLPLNGVLGMHCSANMGDNGNTALFFGLSGTGKTTLSADPKRRLIGDDEHGWSDNGIFNIEGGCYAKCINLSQENEPQIYNSIKFGAFVENVVLDETTHIPDYSSDKYTENTRVAYPVDFIPNCVLEGTGKHPSTVIFLSADAFGVLPPVSKLTPEQAMYYFVSGYTAKVAGTERGIVEPTATFSTCFGSPFLPLRPEVYANMLGEKLKKHNLNAYLINTGWSGGKYGVGKRMSISATRAIVSAAAEGKLDSAKYETEPFFGLSVPVAVEGVDPKLLNPKNSWADKSSYDETAKKLAGLFSENIKKYSTLPENIKNAGPKA